MKQTVEQLFSIESRDAYIPLMWGGRLESPAEVAARIWSTMGLIKDHATGGSGFGNPIWMMLADDGLGFVPVPNSLPEVEQIALKKTEMRNGVRSGSTAVQFVLKSPEAESDAIASFHTLAGKHPHTLGNSANFSFKPSYPLGTPKDAAALFRGLIRIWQPDAGILSTMHTIHEIPDLYDTYAGYLSWISRAVFGAPPPLTAATSETFGDGTLLTARNWTIPGVQQIYEELLHAGAPSLVDGFPMTPQEVPDFPADDRSPR